MKTRPDDAVGMSEAQFEVLEQGTRYRLYVVKRGTTDGLRTVKIQDRAVNPRTCTIDEGWSEVPLFNQVNMETGEVKA